MSLSALTVGLMDVAAVVRDSIRDRHSRQREPGGPSDRGPSIRAIEAQTRRCLKPAGKSVLLAVGRPRDPTPILHGRRTDIAEAPCHGQGTDIVLAIARRCIAVTDWPDPSATGQAGLGLRSALQQLDLRALGSAPAAPNCS